jgi:hypothetical protein
MEYIGENQSMDSADRTVRQWAGLPRATLAVKVAAMVRQPPQDPSQFWRRVGDDVVLAAAVRGILAGLLRDKQGNRDESFWAYRIATVRAVLDSPEQAPAITNKVAASPVPAAVIPSRDFPSGPGIPAEVVAPPVPTRRAGHAVPGIEFRAP